LISVVLPDPFDASMGDELTRRHPEVDILQGLEPIGD